MKSVLFSLALCAVLSFPVFASDSESQAHQVSHPAPIPTLESAAATDGSFGNSTALVPVWKGLVAEGLWYHSQGRNIGFGGVGYAIRPHHSAILIPSVYGVRGNGEHDTMALGFRAIVETRRVLADIGILRTFGGKNGEDHDLLVDPSHISARIGKLQAGYAVEFFRHIGESHVTETHNKTTYHLAAATSPTIAHSSTHKTDEWLHGPRIGWELSTRVHMFYAALYKGGNHWEHKLGTTFFFADMFRKKK